MTGNGIRKPFNERRASNEEELELKYHLRMVNSKTVESGST